MMGTIIFDKNFYVRKKIINMLFYVLIFFSVFDQSREALPLPSIVNSLFPLIRDCLIIYFFIRNFSKNINSLFILIPCFFLISTIIGFLNLHSLKPLKEMWNYLKFFLIYYIFLYEDVFLNNKDKILLFYLKSVVIVFLFNIIAVLGFSSFLTRTFSAGLRLTVGNSSIVSYLYISALMVVLYFDVTSKRKLYVIIYIIAIISTVTTTAFIALVPIIFIYFIKKLNFKQKIIVLFLTFFSIIVLFKVFSSIEFLSSFFDYFKDKWKQIIELFSFNSEIGSIGTLSIREQQKRNLLSNMNLLDYIFGLGFSGYNKYIDFMVENQFITFLSIFGLLGFIFLIFFMAKYILVSFLSGNEYNISVLCVVACYSYTLVIFLPYISNFVTAFLFALSSKYYKKNDCLYLQIRN